MCKAQAPAVSSSLRGVSTAGWWLISCLCFERKGEGRNSALVASLPLFAEWHEAGPGSGDGYSPLPTMIAAAAASSL